MRFAVPAIVLVVCLTILWQLVVTPRLLARKARKQNKKSETETWNEAREKAKAEPPTYPQASATDLNSDNWGTPT